MTFTLFLLTTDRRTSRHRWYVYLTAGLWFSGSSNTTGLTIIREFGASNGALAPSSEGGHGTLRSSSRMLYSRQQRLRIYRILTVILSTWGGLWCTNHRQRNCKRRRVITGSLDALTTTRYGSGRFSPKCNRHYTWAPLFRVRVTLLPGTLARLSFLLLALGVVVAIFRPTAF